MRDLRDNVIIICSIENFDPMGVHTGDSITVAPAQTLSDREYQRMRDAAIAVMREIGVETGGSNVQFGVHPTTGRQIVIEMNPRVSRTSALASKATGFPIAKIAAKLAVGYTLDEIPNDITHKTPACFEPTLDYVVVKIPKWQFEKFPGADENLGPQMKSVGEVMAHWPHLQGIAAEGSALARYRQDGGLRDDRAEDSYQAPGDAASGAAVLCALRSAAGAYGQARGQADFDRSVVSVPAEGDQRHAAELEKNSLESIPTEVLRDAKRMGISDGRLSGVWRLDGKAHGEVRHLRKKHGIAPVYKRVDTCAAEFESFTPYLYSTYEEEDEAAPTAKKKVIILGSGPNRIGQGIEFDYCCCHARSRCATMATRLS